MRDPAEPRGGVALWTPIGTHCQEDLGHAGPGSLQLSLCGDLLTFADGEATLTVTGGKPLGLVVLVIGMVANPTPFRGGMLVPSPWAMTLVRVADAQGSLTLVVPGAGGPPVRMYVQAVQPLGGGVVHLSNALEVARGT